MLTMLMDISEAETGMLRLERERLRVDAVLADAAALYADIAEDKGVTLVADCPPGLEVSADKVRLRQVVSNLVDNAVKYTPPGGRVTLSARPDDAGVAISVTDTGIGIPASEQSRIWERLYRGDQSRSERGLGLGLSLVRAIVQAHGGHVDVVSQPGEGATFTVILPNLAQV
jgi:signal transduction histidine kinase